MRKNSIRRWIILSFTAALILSMAVFAVADYYENSNSAIMESEETAGACAFIVSNLFENSWDNDEVLKSTRDKAYVRAAKTLRVLCNAFQLDSLSIYRVDPAVPARYYYFSVTPDETKNDAFRKERALQTVPTKELLPGEKALINGSRQMQEEIDDNVTLLSAITDEDGRCVALVSMVYDSAPIKETILHDFLRDIITSAVLLLFALLFLLLLVQRRIIRPIGILSDSMKSFASGDHIEPKSLDIHSRDEIGEIAASYEKMTEDISAYVDNIESLTKEQTEMRTQLELGRRIQHGLVPERTDLSGEGFCVSALTRPAKMVGGDFYDCFQRDDASVCIVMGDVSGKGVSAAISMAMMKTIIREKLMMGLSPAQTLNQTNDQICAQNPENQFATAFVAVLDTKTGGLVYCNAGHTHPVLLQEEPAFLIPESGIALGLFEDAGLEDQTVTLSPHQGILLYTDGVTDAVDPKRDFFGEERLLEAAKGWPSYENAAEETVRGISSAVESFCAGNEPFDDMALLALVYEGGRREWRSLPVALSAFDEVKEAVFAVAGDSPQTRQALVACDEALANIVRYSGAADLAFTCEMRDGLLCITLSDDGRAFDPTAVVPEEKEFEQLDSGGMGLNLIRKSVSSMRYERKEDRNFFTMVFVV